MTQEAPAVQRALTDEEVEQFLTTGLVVVEQCFDPADAAAWVEQGWDRLGVDPEDPGTWGRPRVHLPTQETVDVSRFAPRALAAALQLLGGPERAVLPWEWGDGFIANLGVGADRPFDPPSASVGGWHKDGDFFRHFLDRPSRGC